MFAKILLAPVDSLEAHCAAVALDDAGLPVTAVPEPDVDAVVLFAFPGAPLARTGEMLGDGRDRPLLLVASRKDPAAPQLADRLGAAGVVDWSAPTPVLVDAVHRLSDGQRWRAAPGHCETDPLRDLTERELEIVRLLGEGATNEAISRALGISYHTVRTHVAHVLAKLGVSHRYAVVALARRHERSLTSSLGGSPSP